MMYSLDDLYEQRLEQSQENARRICADEVRDTELWREVAGPVEGLCCDVKDLLLKVLQGSGEYVKERLDLYARTDHVLAIITGSGWCDSERREAMPTPVELSETILATVRATEEVTADL